MSTANATDRPFLHAARKALQTHKHSTFARYLAPDLVIVATPSSTSSNVAIRHFEISRAGYEDPPWLRMKVSMFFAPDAKGRLVLMVKCSNGAQTLESYLAALPAPSMRRMSSEESYQLQWQWWQARGKIFDFNGLSTELQDMLLLQMAGEVRLVTQNWYLGQKQCYYYENHQRPTCYLTMKPADLALCRLSKDINARLQPIIREQTIKQFCGTEDFMWHFRNPKYLYPHFMPNLTRIMLDLWDSKYVQFFHNETLPNRGNAGMYSFPGEPPAAYLSKLPNLRYLELWFHSTMDVLFYDEHPWRFNDVYDPYENRQYPCRKGMVDLIMLLAYQYINQIPSINMTGYVKTVTRNKWLGIFREIKSAVRRQEVEQDIEAETVRALLPENCPPKCSCAFPCGYKGLLHVWGYEGQIDHLQRNSQKDVEEALEEYEFDFEDDFRTA